MRTVVVAKNLNTMDATISNNKVAFAAKTNTTIVACSELSVAVAAAANCADTGAVAQPKHLHTSVATVENNNVAGCFSLVWNAHRNKGSAASIDVITRRSRRRCSCLPSLLLMVALSSCICRPDTPSQASSLLIDIQPQAKTQIDKHCMMRSGGRRRRVGGMLPCRCMLAASFGEMR